MDRGTKDEAFVSRALELSDFECGRWIANQANFNHSANAPLSPATKAALVTAVNIYVQKAEFAEAEIDKALQVHTVGEARALIDRLWPAVPKS